MYRLKVLHINYSDVSGGAARAAFRLHKGLQNAGFDSRILVQRKKGTDGAVCGPTGLINKARALLGSQLDFWLKQARSGRSPIMFSPANISGTDIGRFLSLHPVDLVNLHWICGGMLSIESIQKISQPVVWTLHDMWPFTGGCHCDEGCNNHQEGCGNCPLLARQGDTDLSARVLERKRKSFEGLNLTVVAPSQWMAEKAQKSTLFRNTTIQVIHNGLDLSIFSPAEKREARHLLHLPEDRELLLFGAMDATTNPGKGFDLLVSGLQHLSKDWSKRAELVVFGSDGLDRLQNSGFKVHFLGDIHDDHRLATIYSAASLMVVPSRQDNLPNTVSEAMACGTPVVAFNIGGIPEMIEHGKSGYLANAFDTGDLAQGIKFVLTAQSNNQDMANAARKNAEEKFSSRQMAQEYLSLYQSILTG